MPCSGPLWYLENATDGKLDSNYTDFSAGGADNSFGYLWVGLNPVSPASKGLCVLACVHGCMCTHMCDHVCARVGTFFARTHVSTTSHHELDLRGARNTNGWVVTSFKKADASPGVTKSFALGPACGPLTCADDHQHLRCPRMAGGHHRRGQTDTRHRSDRQRNMANNALHRDLYCKCKWVWRSVRRQLHLAPRNPSGWLTRGGWVGALRRARGGVRSCALGSRQPRVHRWSGAWAQG